MNLWESLRTALSAIFSNKMRASLTMLGIIIGVAAVVALSALGEGVEDMVSDTISGMGSNLIYITPSTPEDQLSPAQLTMEDYGNLSDPFNTPSVSAVAPTNGGALSVSYDDQASVYSVTGTTVDLAEIQNLEIAAGGWLTEADVEDNARVAVLGADVYTELFGDAYPIDKAITIDGTRFSVVGVLDTVGGMMNQDSGIYVPITTAQSRLLTERTLSGDYPVSTILASATSEEVAPQAVAEIEATLRAEHGIGEGDEDDFSVTSQDQMLDMSSQITGVLTTFLTVVAGISLLVGGIGIMNIMLVTVTERTREIGIRKAIGGTNMAVMAQFLIESLVLTLVGGLLGLALGVGASNILSVLIDITASITPTMVTAAVGISCAIGVIFGLYPAWRAAKLHPIQALRYE